MKYETLRRIEKNGVYIAEFDPKVHCKYNPNVLCIRLYLGKFECSGFVDNKKQFKEKHEMEIVFWHLFCGGVDGFFGSLVFIFICV